MKLLHIDSSITGDYSVSRQLTASIITRLKKTSPDPTITYRDVALTPIPHQSPSIQFAKWMMLHEMGMISGEIGEIVATAVHGGANVDAVVQAELDETTAVLDEFLDADTIVLGAPMYNFGIPSQLKAWIDCLAAPGKTFNYTATGVEGLAGNKKMIIASSRGGIYSAPSPRAPMDHQETFLTSFFSFIGITDITFIRAEGVNLGAEQRQRSLESALAEAAAL